MLTSQSVDFSTITIEARTHGHVAMRQVSDPKGTLVGFHGYAENAEKHLEELLRIPGLERWSVAAVQALHPFYVQRTGEVVASWMTKLDRELAIADNIDYIRRVISHLGNPRPLVFLGFSQGAAMAYRAAAAVPCDAVIALAGDLPPDVIPAAAKLPPLLLGRGVHDEWYSSDKLAKDLEVLTLAELCVFHGGHEWTDEFRSAASKFLGGVVER